MIVAGKKSVSSSCARASSVGSDESGFNDGFQQHTGLFVCCYISSLFCSTKSSNYNLICFNKITPFSSPQTAQVVSPNSSPCLPYLLDPSLLTPRLVSPFCSMACKLSPVTAQARFQPLERDFPEYFGTLDSSKEPPFSSSSASAEALRKHTIRPAGAVSLKTAHLDCGGIEVEKKCIVFSEVSGYRGIPL